MKSRVGQSREKRKIRREKSRRKSQKKEDAKVGKSRNIVFFE